jgi:hypothetical protein
MPLEDYDAYSKPMKMKRAKGMRFASVWTDVANKKILKESPQATLRYVVPRSGRTYGFPYGFSRATLVALPDARLIQQQALAILEAAEKQVNPALIAYSDTIRGDVRTGATNSHGLTVSMTVEPALRLSRWKWGSIFNSASKA